MAKTSGRAIQVYFTPPEIEAVAGATLIVVDTLRATTVMTTLIAGGASAVYACGSHEAARAVGAALPASRLCGETGGLPPPGFDYGNSPSEFARLDVRGWTLVQSTSNGTRALSLAAQAQQTLVGCLRNRAAVARATPAVAGDVTIVCSGEAAGTAPSVEDSFTAGAIVEALVADERDGASALVQLRDGARLALRIFQSYAGGAGAAMADSTHAAELRALGFEHDVAFCGQVDAETCVPVASLDGEGRVVVRA